MEDSSQTTKKSLFKKLVLVCFALFLGVSLFMTFQIPFKKISLLQDGYVRVDFDKSSQTSTYHITKTRPERWISLQNISAHVQDSVVISEDWAFYEHHGVDVQQLKSALEEYLSDGKKLRGASTLSQQLVKNLFLSPERSLKRKAQELVITLVVEKSLSKQKILEIYLNVVEFGDGIHGVEAGARKYFKKSAKDLNAKEAAFLAMLLPSPKRYAVSFEERALTDYAKKTISDILEKRQKVGQLSEDEVNAELRRLLNFERPQRKSSQAQVSFKSGSSLKRPEVFDDGSSFEKRYRQDDDLVFKAAADFDPRSLEAVELDENVEFSLE